MNRSRQWTEDSEQRQPRARKGVALVFVLVFVVAMAALAMSSIFLASNANLLAKSYDKERDLKYAAEMGLQIGKSRVNQDPTILVMQPNQLDTAILVNATLTDASGQPMTGIQVSVYVGPTGSTSGQFGRFSSIVSIARDTRNNAFIRRLELTQESFAKFAYWSNQENSAAGTTIFFNNGDQLWGPVWSNDTISIGSGGASFHDEVGTVYMVSGANYGTFSKGYKQYQKPIQLPSTAVLNTLQTISASSGWDFASGRAPSTNEQQVLDRLEFVAADLNASGDSTDLNEGMFRIFTVRGNTDAVLRGDWPGGTNVSSYEFCGDWHTVRVGGVAGTLTPQFFPASVHPSAWFKTMDSLALRDGGASANSANTTAANEQAASLQTIMQHPNARCYLPGDPHLAPVERNSALAIDPRTAAAYTAVPSSWQKGGMDSTFTPVGKYGTWKLNTNTPNAAIVGARGDKATGAAVGSNIGDSRYLYPIDRLYNTSAKGVIHFNGNVGLSGTLNGRITLYANGTIVLLDDLRYANDPVKGVCRDILGIISDKDIVVADNSLLDPQPITAGGTLMMPDETKDIDIHAVMMALGTSFRVENYNSGPTNFNDCGTVNNGRGCINLSGGLIQKVRGAVGTSGGTGFAKRYSYDHCAVVNPPPYFPTTGRFLDNRYLELDPAGFNDKAYFLSLTPGP